MFKLLNGVGCHLAGTQLTLLDGVPDKQKRGKNWGMNSQLKHAIPNCYYHLANTNEDLGGLDKAISPFAKLLWTLLIFYAFLFFEPVQGIQTEVQTDIQAKSTMWPIKTTT